RDVTGVHSAVGRGVAVRRQREVAAPARKRVLARRGAVAAGVPVTVGKPEVEPERRRPAPAEVVGEEEIALRAVDRLRAGRARVPALRALVELEVEVRAAR